MPAPSAFPLLACCRNLRMATRGENLQKIPTAQAKLPGRKKKFREAD